MYAKWRTRLSVAALLAFSAAALMALSAVASADEASNTHLECWTSHDFTDDDAAGRCSQSFKPQDSKASRITAFSASVNSSIGGRTRPPT